MRAERLDAIFRRDLDQIPALAESELVPTTRRRRLAVSGVGALAAIVVFATVVGLSVQAVRDAQLAQRGGTDLASSYFIAEEVGAGAFSPSASVITDAALRGAPTCPAGQLPWIAVSHPPPPGSVPGTGAVSVEAAFRRASPASTEFTMYPWGVNEPVRGDDPRIGVGPVWIVSGGETFVAAAPGYGRPGETNNWFAFPAKFMGCRTLTNLRSTGGG